MPQRATAWQVPRIFTLYPGLLVDPPMMRTDRSGLVQIKWTNTETNGPTSVVLVLSTIGPYEWDYTIYDKDLGFLRHHHGPHGDPDRDPWEDVGLKP